MGLKFFTLHNDYSVVDMVGVMEMAELFKKLDKEKNIKYIDDLQGHQVLVTPIQTENITGAKYIVNLTKKNIGIVFKNEDQVKITEKNGKVTTVDYINGSLKIDYSPKDKNKEEQKNQKKMNNLSDVDKRIHQWLNSDSTGLSSLYLCKKIFPHIKHPDIKELGRSVRFPYDPSDLNRCIKFLNAVPEAREHLDKLNNSGNIWKDLIKNWTKLETSLNQEKDDPGLQGKAPKTYAMMKEITEQAYETGLKKSKKVVI